MKAMVILAPKNSYSNNGRYDGTFEPEILDVVADMHREITEAFPQVSFSDRGEISVELAHGDCIYLSGNPSGDGGFFVANLPPNENPWVVTLRISGKLRSKEISSPVDWKQFRFEVTRSLKRGIVPGQ
jgi:hypothetical protein